MTAGEVQPLEGTAAPPPTLAAEKDERYFEEEVEDDDEEDDSWSSDSDVGDALDWLDSRVCRTEHFLLRRRIPRLPARCFSTPQRPRGPPLAAPPAACQPQPEVRVAHPLQPPRGMGGETRLWDVQVCHNCDKGQRDAA